MCPAGTSGDDRGFTLIELLVVIALLSIAMVMFCVWLPGLEDRLDVDQSARQIERVLERSAEKARTSGYDQVIEFDAMRGAPKLITGQREIDLDPGVEMTWLGAREVGANSEGSAIAFLATGGSSGGAIELRRGQARTQVDVDWLTGSVRQEAAGR